MRTDSRPVRVALVVGFVLTSAVALAQNSRWADPYQKALRAIEAKDYAVAIPLLERAIAADPRSAANKVVEGVFRIDYFPHYYLGIAQLELKQYDRARDSFAMARPSLPKVLLARLDQYEKQLVAETAAARGPAPTGDTAGAGASARGGSAPAAPTGASPNRAFEQHASTATTALNDSRFADAVTAFDAAKAADAAEFARQNLPAKRDQAARSLRGQQLADEGRQLLVTSQIAAAKRKLQEADQLLPGQKSVADALTDIRQREDNYQRLKTAAEDDVRRNSLQSAQSALRKFAAARSADPELFASDNLESRVTFVQQRIKELAAAQAPESSAPAPGSTTAPKDAGLGASGAGTTPTPHLAPEQAPEQDRAAFRTGLVALLRGDSARSIATFEAALAKGARGDLAVGLHAYLGVAYAAQALSTPARDAANHLREQALAQFRLARQLNPQYRLSDRVVSPAIIALFQQIAM